MGLVAMNDFAAEPQELLQAELAACERVLRSGYWILGGEVRQFESRWAQWLGQEHAIGCGNGLDAIELGLRALGIGPGDEVITTPMTAFATVLAVVRAGAVPVLADIDPATAALDPGSVVRCIGAATKAVVLVHLYGQVAGLDEFLALSRKHGIHLIEDCAQAHGARWGGKTAGSFGSFGAWSFYPTKNLGAVGDAGAITTADAALAESLRRLRNYGQSERYHHPLLGANSRLDELQAAILGERLHYLTQWTERRRQIARRYAAEIRNPHVRPLPLPADAERHVHHLFVVTTPKRAELQEHLRLQQVQSLIHYPIPIHFQDPCRDIRRDPRGLAMAEAHAGSCLSLPCHPGLQEQDIERVIHAVNRFGA